jgi:hypothetical protein
MRYLCAILCFAAGLCLAAPDSGQELVFKDLSDIPRRPLDAAGKDGSVLIFYWQDCPVSNGYAPELNRIAASKTNFSFYIVQIDPNLTQTAAKEHARQFNLQMPVLLDPEHRLVKLTKATATPEAVVIGKTGQILYRGRIDDTYAAFGKKRAAARHHDLLEALNAIAAGKSVKQKETTVIGCLIE